MNAVRITALLLVPFCLASCEKLMRNMYDGAKVRPLQPSARFADGRSSRSQVPGTEEHARGILAATSSGRAVTVEQRRLAAERATSIPYPITMALLQRGRERFDIYCSPCHSIVGDGEGMVVGGGGAPPARLPRAAVLPYRAAARSARSPLLRRHHARLRRDVPIRRPRGAR
jgi:hypothetical protein